MRGTPFALALLSNRFSFGDTGKGNQGMTMKKHLVTVSALALGALFANVANANVITLYGDWTQKDDYYNSTTVRGSVGCSLSCVGLLSTLPSGSYDSIMPDVSTAGGWSSTSADLFYLPSDSEATETAFVNEVIDGNLPTGTKTSGNGGLSWTFTSAAMYILLKIGSEPNMALLWNTSGVLQTYTFSGVAGTGSGISHVLGVPEPETLLLLLPGVAAMAMGMRRRKVAVAA